MHFSVNTSQTALFALDLICLLLKKSAKVSEKTLKDEISQLVESQAFILSSIVAAGDSKQIERAFQNVSKLLLVHRSYILLMRLNC